MTLAELNKAMRETVKLEQYEQEQERLASLETLEIFKNLHSPTEE